MADLNHTLESSSAQEKPSYTINLIVQNVGASTPQGVGSIAHSVISGQYNPCVVLQGAWLRELGFEVGDPIRVLAKPGVVRVIPGSRYMEPNTMVKFEVDGTISHVDFREAVDGIKAEKDYTIDAKGSGKDNGRDVGEGRGRRESGDKDIRTEARKDTGKSHKDTAKSKDISDVLTGVKSGLDYV